MRSEASSPQPLGEGSTWQLAGAALVFSALSACVALTFRDYGITWDEYVQQNYGERVFRYFSSSFRDLSATEYLDLYAYGGSFDLLAVLLQKLVRLDPYDVRHGLNAFVGLVGIAGTYRLAAGIKGPRAGLLALMFLASCPRWWGHMFANPKDIPFAAGFVWALLYLREVGKRIPSVPLSLWVKLGVAIGVTLSIRVGGVLLFAFLGLELAWQMFRTPPRLWHVGIFRCAPQAVSTVVIAWVIMVAAWPWAHRSPLANPVRAFLLFAHFPSRGMNLMAGKEHFSGAPPYDYGLHWFGVTIPELHIVVLVAGACLAAFAVARRARHQLSISGDVVRLCLVVSLPELYISLSKATLLDEVRHSLFVLPPLMVLAAISFDSLMSKLPRNLKILGLAACVAWGGDHLRHVVTLHPYEMVYFNRFVGRLNGAADSYETDYWGSSFREAARRLNELVPRRRPFDGRNGDRWLVSGCGSPTSWSHYLGPQFKVALDPSSADFFFVHKRWHCDERFRGTRLLSVERFGVSLSSVVRAAEGIDAELAK